MVELYCPHRMTMKRVVLMIASLWINCDCQRFTSVSEKQDVPLGANVSLIWNFDVESGTFETGVWSNTQGRDVMSKFGNETSETLPGFKTKIVPYGQYGMTVLNVMEEDSGAYTAVFAIGVGGSTVQFPEKAYIQGHNVSVPLDFVMYIEGNSTNDTVESGATVNVTVVAPPNDPPSINVSITIYTETPYVTGDWPNSDETMPRSLDFEVPSDKLLTLLTVEACLSHPAVSNQTCKEEQFTIQNLPMCQSCKNGGTCNQATLKCICPDGFTGDTCEIDPQQDKCKWWCILIIVLVVVSVVVIIICCCCWHYKVACFAHKCCPWSSNHSRPSTAACSKVDVNDVERTVTSGSHGNKQDAGNKDSPYRPDGNMPQKGDGSHGLHVPQGVPVTSSDQKRPMPSPGRKTVLPPLEDPERSKKKKKKNRKSREEE